MLWQRKCYGILSLNIAMGIEHCSDVKDFWSTDPILSHLWFPSIMVRDRFLQILYYLQLNNNENDSGNEKPFKLRPVLDHLLRQCKKHYHPRPRREVSIDEQMVGTKVSFSIMVIFFSFQKSYWTKNCGMSNSWLNILSNDMSSFLPSFRMWKKM